MRNPITTNHIEFIYKVADNCSKSLLSIVNIPSLIIKYYIYEFNEPIKGLIRQASFYAGAIYLSDKVYNYAAINHYSNNSSLMLSACVHAFLCNPANDAEQIEKYPKSTMLTSAVCGVIVNSVMNYVLNKGASNAATAIGNAFNCSAPIKICQVTLGIITLAFFTCLKPEIHGLINTGLS